MTPCARRAAFSRGIVSLAALITLTSCDRAWEVEHQLEIEADAERVWQLLSQLDRYAEWNPYSRRVEGELAVGEVVVVEAHLHDEIRYVDNVITRVDPPRHLCWQSTNWYGFLVRGIRCRHIDPIAPGRIRLRHHEIMQGPLAGLVESVYRERIVEGIELADNALKAAAESRARAEAHDGPRKSPPDKP